MRRFLLLPLSPGLLLFIIMSRPAELQAQELSKTYQTQYATISYARETDLHSFTRNIGSGLSFLSEGPEKNPLLAKSRVDKIVETVTSLLDMHPLNFHFSIHIYKSHAEVAAIYRAMGMLGAAPVAFYFHGQRNISVSFESITDRILAHEIAHVVICAYYTPPPPVRMQEILAQYVDRHLWDN